jgi:hypothetical protein
VQYAAVLRVVPVHVHDRLGDADPDQLPDGADDTCLFHHLSCRRLRWMLAWIDDASHRRPPAIVRAVHQQDLLALQDYRRDPREPEEVMADPFAQAENEIRDGHTDTVLTVASRRPAYSA